MPVKKGDFILLDYTGKVKETGKVFDTTIESVAKDEGLWREGELYEPKLIVVGEGWMLKSLEEKLVGLKINEKETVEIPPELAFGNRDPSKVKMVPLRRLTARDIRPTPGMRIEWDGRLAIVRTIGSGRVQLDFNPPLAGKTLVYEVTVKKVLRRKLDKVKALIHRRLPIVDIEKFQVKTTGNEVTVEIPEEAFYLEGLQLAKRGLFLDIQKFFPKTSAVVFIEAFRKREASEEKPQ